MNNRDGMLRIFALALALLLAACHGAQSVYNEPMPAPHDAKVFAAVGGELKPADKEAWDAITTLQMKRGAAPLRSKTVGDAIARWKAQRACLQVHAQGQDSAGGDVRARNREMDAYNDCLQMEL